MKLIREIPSIFAALVLKVLEACLRAITSELFWQTVFLVSPFVLLACIPVLNNSFTQRQIGILLQIFTVFPLIVPVWERMHRSAWNFDWYVMHLGNWFYHRGWNHIAEWFRQHDQHRLSDLVMVYVMAVAIIFYVAGLLFQLLA